MSVKTTRAFSAYWNYQTWHLAAGEEVTGGLADYLLATGCPVEDLATAPAAEDPGDQVPDGTVAEVADWVGDDRDRARAALDGEQAKGDGARSTLVAALEKLLSAE